MPTETNPYVMKMRGAWRVVVPVRGKLTARLCDASFATKPLAESWMHSADGRSTIEALRHPFGASEAA